MPRKLPRHLYVALKDQIRIWKDKPHGENQGQKGVRIWRDKPHGENQGQKEDMCLNAWEICGIIF